VLVSSSSTRTRMCSLYSGLSSLFVCLFV
jgi:hypothetical protein